MANTKTNTQILLGKGEVIQYYTLAYVDSATETDVVVYDSSAVASALGIDDPLTCTILEVHALVSAASTARVRLDFKATSNVLACSLPANVAIHQKPRKSVPWKNYAGSGINGDVVLNASGLSTGDTITIELHVRPK